VPFAGKNGSRVSGLPAHLVAQTTTSGTGLSAEEAATKVDLTRHSVMFPQIRAVGVDAAATRRIYRLAQDPNAGPTP
jgi:hypothetical protein